MMIRQLVREVWVAIRGTIALVVVVSVGYTAVVTVVGQLAFNSQANGSLLTAPNGETVGSSLIGQCFYKTTTAGTITSYLTTKDDQGHSIFAIDPRYFQSRPSFTVDSAGKPLPCNAANSSASNLGPTNPALISRIKGYTDYLHAMGIAKNADGTNAAMPIDLVTGDFSGFDPDISEAAALAQVNMVAAARHVPAGTLERLVISKVQGRALGIFGSPHVNVLDLNRALSSPGS